MADVVALLVSDVCAGICTDYISYRMFGVSKSCCLIHILGQATDSPRRAARARPVADVARKTLRMNIQNGIL